HLDYGRASAWRTPNLVYLRTRPGRAGYWLRSRSSTALPGSGNLRRRVVPSWSVALVVDFVSLRSPAMKSGSMMTSILHTTVPRSGGVLAMDVTVLVLVCLQASCMLRTEVPVFYYLVDLLIHNLLHGLPEFVRGDAQLLSQRVMHVRTKRL